MNADEFEKQLKQQALRPLPPGWRAEILERAAQARVGAQSTDARVAWWRAWLWPSPIAWGAVGAVWVAILVLNHQDSENHALIQAAKPAPAPLQMQMALEQKHGLLAELIREMDFDPAVEPAQPFIPKPRSERFITNACA